MRQKIERKKHLFGVPMTIWEKLEEIQDELGLSNYNDVFQYCVIFTHEKKLENYAKIMKEKRRTASTPEERAQNRVLAIEAEKKAAKELNRIEGERICGILDGEIIETNGLYSCKYDTFEIVNPNYATKGTMTVPFEMLTESHITRQVKPLGATREEAKTILAQMPETQS